MRSNCLLLLIFISVAGFTSNKALAETTVARTTGKAYLFKQRNAAPVPLKGLTKLQPGHIIGTGNSSTITLDFDSNGILYIAENSVVLIRGTTPKGVSLVSLLKGRVLFQNKPEWKERTPGVVLNVRNQDTGFLGQAYFLEYTDTKKELLVKEGNLWKVPLKLKTIEAKASDEEEDEYDEEDEEEIDQLLFSADEFSKLVDERKERSRQRNQRAGGVEIKDERKTKIDFKMIFRGVHYSAESRDKLLTETNFNNDTTEDVTFRNLTPKQNVFDGRLEWNLERQIDSAVIVGSGWFEYGTENDIYRDVFQVFNDRKKTRGVIEFNELYFQNSWDNFDLTVGKKIVRSGFGIITTPVDNITPKDLYDPVDQKNLGNWMFLTDYYPSSGGTLSYSLLPFFLTNKKYVSPVEDSVGNRINPVVTFPESSLSDFSHYLRYKTTFSGYDFYVGAFYGYSLFPVYRGSATRDATSSTGIKEGAFEDYVKVNQYSLGLSTTVKSAVLYTDWLYQNSVDKTDDNFVQGLIGIQEKFGRLASWVGLNQIHFITELTYTHYLTELDKTSSVLIADELNNNPDLDYVEGYVSSSAQERGYNKNVLLRLTFEYNEKTNFAVTYNRDFDVNSQTYQLGFELKPFDNFSAKAYYEKYTQDLELAPDGSGFSFGGFTINPKGGERNFTFDRITLKLEYAF